MSKSHQYRNVTPREMAGTYTIEVSRESETAWDARLFKAGYDKPMAAAHGDLLTVFGALVDRMLEMHPELHRKEKLNGNKKPKHGNESG